MCAVANLARSTLVPSEQKANSRAICEQNSTEIPIAFKKKKKKKKNFNTVFHVRLKFHNISS